MPPTPRSGLFKIISESRLGNYGDTKRKTRDTLRQALSGIYRNAVLPRVPRQGKIPESFDSNYAVLKRMEEAEQSLAAVESYYEGLDVTPKFYSKPDSVTLEESRAFFEAHGYAVHTFECQRMMLLTHTSPELLVHKCPVQIFAGAPLTGAAAQLVTESCGRKGLCLRLIDKQPGRGRARFVCIQPR